MIYLGVKGLKPKKPPGEAFEVQFHVWAHVLSYCYEVAPVIHDCMQPHPSLGGGPSLNAEKSRQLAEKLYEEIYGGRTQQHIAKLPSQCKGHLRVETVRAFAEFLKDCGGFRADD